MKDKKIRIVKLTTIITVIVMFISIIILTCQFIKIANFRDETRALEQQKETLINDIYNYNTSNSYYDNNRNEFLEDYARETLTWGASDEVWYTKN